MESKSTPSTKPATKKTCAIKRCRIYRWLRLKLFACLQKLSACLQKLWQSRPHPLTFIQRQWHTISLVILYIFFRPTFETHIAPLFSQFDPSFISTCFWYGIIIVGIVYTIILIRRKYVLSEKVLLWALVILLGWWYYRFKGIPNYEVTKIPAEWTPQYISNIDLLYIDLLLVIGGCIIVVQVFSWARPLGSYLYRPWKRKQANRDAGIEGYIVDYPITAEDEDRLGRSKKAFDLAKKIFHTDTSKAAFTLGLTAPWGAGKTSFMLAMQQYLRDNHCSEIILIEFNPWMYRKAPNLTQIFFEELSRALAPYSSALASGFMQYVDYILSKENNTWIQLGARLLPQGFKAKSTSEQYEFLNKEIGKLGKKIIIFIDDVDRLDSEELTELFCLVRNISPFRNMSYILAYDKKYVTTQLKNKFDKDTDRYMEKILQEEYPLAKITPKQLEDALMALLEKHSQGYPHLKEDIQKSGIQIEQHLPTLRAIKRIYNVLLSTPQDLRERIAHFDWFVIELIRIQYPLLFDFLKTKYTQAFLVWGDRRVVIKLEGEERNALLSEDTIEGEVVDFTQYLHKNKEELGIENPNHILELMKKIWGKDRSNVIPQINDWECIGRYFYRTMREGEFDIAQLHQYLSLPFTDGQQHPMKMIIPYVDGIHTSSYWKRFCSIIHEIDLKQEQTVNMLYLYFYILSLEKVQPLFSPECDKWITSLREQEGEREREILENIFAYPDIRKGVLLYISSILNRAEEVRIPFSSDELEVIKEKLFLEYMQDDTSIDPIDCYRLWFKCQTYLRIEPDGNHSWQIDPVTSSPKMNTRMREIIEKNIVQLIPYFVQKSLINPPVERMYRLLLPYPIWTLAREEETNEIKYFPKFISELDASSSKWDESSSNTIKEFQEFLDKWLGYIDILEIYLTSTRDNALYSNLTQMDQYYITELRKQPEYLQSLVNNPQKFLQLLRYRSTKCELGFIRFTFKSITPQDIMTDNLEESPSIEL